MALSWNEIKSRADRIFQGMGKRFQRTRRGEVVYGCVFQRLRHPAWACATFEAIRQKSRERQGFIDLLWKGNDSDRVQIVAAKILTKLHKQAKDIFPGSKQTNCRNSFCLRFRTFSALRFGRRYKVEFKIEELVNNVKHFGYCSAIRRSLQRTRPGKRQSGGIDGQTARPVRRDRFVGHAGSLSGPDFVLSFCRRHDDFNKQQFQDFIEQRTSEDGSDLAAKFAGTFSGIEHAERRWVHQFRRTACRFPVRQRQTF